MEISITTVTANMIWSAARVRIYPKLKMIEDSIQLLELKDEFCSILQIIFHDNGTEKRVKEDGFVRVIGQKKKDGIAQVIMTTPNGYNFKEEEDDLLFRAVMERVINAIKRTSLKQVNKEKIIAVIIGEMNT